ncbi:MAG: glycosyltransferase [Acidobacteriota bacterium]
MTARVDLHVHSKFSNRPTEWLLRRVAAAESYTEPLEIYRKARARGMDFVTISDHDTIDGALSISHLPGTFLSCEVTTTFPDDGCQIHLLTLGITEGQFREIDRLRGDLYKLRDYLRQEGVLCSVAHPLFRVNERLTIGHVEKLMVLFNRFEALNGIHDTGEHALVRRIFSGLDAEAIHDLAARHRLEPWGERPWEKSFTGGSDDHGGRYIATTWTETPDAAESFDFLAHLRAGRSEPGGEAGSSRRLTQSLYAIAADWHRRAVPAWAFWARRDPLAKLLGELASGPTKAPPRKGLPFWRAKPQDTGFAAESVGFAGIGRDPVARAAAAGRAACEVMAKKFAKRLARGRFASAAEALGELAPLGLALAPHLISLRAQHKDRDLVRAAAARFGAGPIAAERRLWLVDDGEELARPNAAASGLLEASRERGGSIAAAVLAGKGESSCGRGIDSAVPGVSQRVFTPWFDVPVGAEGGAPSLGVPPILEILDLCERERYTEIVVSSPGPLGLAGWLAARILGLPLVALVRTDIPAIVQRITREVFLEDLTRDLVRRFYGAADRLLVATRFERELLVADGFAPKRIEIVGEVVAEERVGETAGRARS